MLQTSYGVGPYIYNLPMNIIFRNQIPYHVRQTDKNLTTWIFKAIKGDIDNKEYIDEQSSKRVM